MGYDLPWEVSSTEWVQFDGQRFSKSRKIGVWIDEALRLEGAEYWRYVLISLRPEQKDTNFTWEEFERKINTELNDVLGNFIHRTITFITARFKNQVPSFKQDQPRDEEVLRKLRESPRIIDDKLGHFRLKEALEQVVQLAREGNRYLNENEPWHTIKSDPAEAEQTLGVAVQLVATIAVELEPFLPNTASKIRKSVFHRERLRWKQAGLTNLKPGSRIRPMQPLFHKVSAQKIRGSLEEIRRQITSEAQA